jgi:diguanylate cyclase (GGDEF)-like protein
MMGDIDHFKKVNDNYGIGRDAVLTEIADRLKTSVRIYDTVGSMVGRISIILPACSARKRKRCPAHSGSSSG